MATEKKLEVIVKTRTNSQTNRKFKTYVVKTKNQTEDGKNIWYDLRFTKEVENKDLPVAHSYIYVNDDMMNVDKSNKYTKVWVHKVNKVEQIEKPVDDLDQYFD